MAKFPCFAICRLLPLLLGLLVVESRADPEEYKDYTGHSVLRVLPRHDEDVQSLRSLEDHPGVEFWKEPTAAKRNVDIRVSPASLPILEKYMQERGLPFDTMVPDIQSAIELERQTRASSPSDGQLADSASFNLSRYHTYDEIMEWLDREAEECGSLCSTINIGRSTEGRDLKVIKIGGERPNRPIVWIDAGIHAREWIAPAAALNIIAELIGGAKNSGPAARYLVNRYTWYVLPVANPDGYDYTWTTDRLWRKTRSVHPNSNCRGTDPNRNWNFHWAGRGTSSDPCSENFHGVSAFSEPETRAMAQFMWSLRERLTVYLSLHSYGQYWLTPWGYTYDVPDDYRDLMDIANLAGEAMRESQGSNYEVGSSGRMLYLAAGGSDDWAKGVAGAKYAYTVELGDTGRHGFLLPPSYIRSTGEAMVNALKSLAVGVLRKRREGQLAGRHAM